jgi:hypothetical protein
VSTEINEKDPADEMIIKIFWRRNFKFIYMKCLMICLVAYISIHPVPLLLAVTVLQESDGECIAYIHFVYVETLNR